MQDALAFLSGLTDDDVTWILETGKEQQVMTGTIIIDEGSQLDSLYIVLSGLFGIRVSTVEGQLSKLGPGELLGEVSFVENLPASATVTALESSQILVIPRRSLEAKIEADPAFAVRLYKSFACILSRRLRERVDELGRKLSSSSPTEDGATGDRWDRIAGALDEFKVLMHKADQAAIKNDDVVPDPLALEIHEKLNSFIIFLNEAIGDEAPLSPHLKKELGAKVQREMLPFLLLTRTGERLYSKPRGYTGDYLTIEWLYRDQPGGSGRLGAVLDRAFLDAPAVRAVRNRRGLLAREIAQVLEQKDGSSARVTSLACGPGREVFDVFEGIENPSSLEASMIDIDFEALAFVSDKIAKRKLRRQMNLINANLVYLATGKQKLDLPDQDLVYSIGLVDYFNDKFVVALMDYVYEHLAPGGKIILGNFHVSNCCKAFIDYVMEWNLIHRNEEDMDCLYSTSRFGRGCTNILFEDEGINMFAECRKE